MEKVNLEELYLRLPEYIQTITQKRKGKMYNCPLCHSGLREHGTPAFNLYAENNTRCHCHSCGFDGNIIDLYLTIHSMENTPPNVNVAITALAKMFGLTTQTTHTEWKPTGILGRRTHYYHYPDGSVFGYKEIVSHTDGSKKVCWYLYIPEENRYQVGLKDKKAPLYHADLLKQNPDDPVFVTEGEKDADTIYNYDGSLSTTIPNGAGFSQWLDCYSDGLRNRDVIILTDNDNAGRAYGEKVARHAFNIAKSVKIIPITAIWQECPEKGDISDAFKALGADETAQLLADAVHNTPFCTPESLPPINDNATVSVPPKKKIEYTFVRLSDVKFEKQEFLWNPYLPIGEITVMYAAGGTGKSYATIGIAADITTGRSLPRYGIEQVNVNPEKVLFISAEDNESIILSRMTEAGGNPKNCFVLKTPKTKKDLDSDSFLLPQNKDDTERIQAFSSLLEQIRPKLVIIDPWSVYIGDDKNMNKANDVRAITNVLTVLAKEYNCAILIVAHVNKMPQTENANNAVSGSTALIDAARSALCVRSFGADSDRRVIIQTKSNYQKKAKSVCYRIINQGENRTARFEWDGFSDLTEDDLTKSARTGKSLADIENDNSDEEENKATAIEVIKRLSVHGQHINISYDRFREELKNECGEDFLPKRPQRFMNSLVSDLRPCGIGIELKKNVKSVLKDNTIDKIPRTGFVIHQMTDGNLMAGAMPK